jgi:NAD(P)-dependent dehydrogenase (short-subunit alcohol dehydrogenase family)
MTNLTPIIGSDFIKGVSGQRVLVTAGASGIGFAIATTLTGLGARVALCDVSDSALFDAKRSSAAGRHGYAFRTPYSSAKFGVIGFTQSLAKELGPSAIRVNAILPGIVEGARMDKVIDDRAKQLGISHHDMEERYLEKVSLRRMVSPLDVAKMVAFLLSDAGKNVSGQSLGVDGNVESL